MAIMISPTLPGSIAPMTRPTLPMSWWSTTIFARMIGRRPLLDEARGCGVEGLWRDPGRGGRARPRRDRRAELRPAALQELEVDVARRLLAVGGRVTDRIDLGPL